MKHKSLTLLFILVAGLCGTAQPPAEEKVQAIHEKVFTIDSHTDTPLWFTRSEFDLAERHDVEESRSRVDLPRMKEGGLDGIFMAAFVGQRERTEEGNRKANAWCHEIIDSIYTQIERYPELAEIALTPEDGYKLEKQGKRAIYIGIENGFPIGKDIANIEAFYKRGARYITLCHTKNNDICDSSTDDPEHNGLSDFGEDVVKEMNRLGMMIDVSHISDKSFYDVLETSDDPVIASHSCARAICDNPRNLTDEMLKKLAEQGGVIQMCILSDYVKEPVPQPRRDSAFNAIREKYNHFENLSDEEMQAAREEWHATGKKYPQILATVADMVDHIDHIVKVAGIEHVGIGTDFDGGGGLADCRDVSEMSNITRELLTRGYSEEDIRKIWGENLMRVFKEVSAK